ncbi:MAG: molecular chaperone DnaJ [Spirochaetaceae bacterium]|nr:MAG: molecular chaperone DnaJ [Spirochaetaceae bacterium]
MKVLEAYRTLGVTPAAPQWEVKQAYHRLLKQFHPDLTSEEGSRRRLEAVVEAYRSLKEHQPRIVPFPSNSRRRPAKPPDVTPEELATLGHLVAHGRSAAMRAFSARRLGNSGKRSAYAFLRPALYDSDPLVVRSAVQAIGTLNVAGCAAELAGLFFRTDPETKHCILDIVEQREGTPRFQDVVLVGMRDRDLSVRKRSLSLYARQVAAAGNARETVNPHG